MENNTQLHQSLNEQPMTLGDWLLTLLLCAIPLVNIILLIVWACSSSTNLNKKNFAKANLIFMAIGIGFIILFAGCALSLASNL